MAGKICFEKVTHRGVKFEAGTEVGVIFDFVKYLITDLCWGGDYNEM